MYSVSKFRAANNDKHTSNAAVINKEGKEVTITDGMVQRAFAQLESYHFYPSDKSIQNNALTQAACSPKLRLVR